jgi:beta-lactamase regulating signal transducer with metallopeptidase domain
MNALPLLLRHALVETLGWVLVHSLWQIALIGLLFAATNRALAGRSANARYAAGCVALAAMLLVPVGSVWLLPLHGFAAAVSNSRGASEDGLREADSQGSGDEVRRAAIRRPAEESLLNENNASSMPAATETSVHPADKLAPKRDWRMTLSTAVRPWLPAAVALWMLGVALCSLRLVYGCAIVRRLRRIGTSAVVEPVAQTARTLMQRMRIRRRVLIVESRLAASPALIGYFKPVVLLPVAAITGLTTRQLEAVIAHELAHVRRHDFLVNALQSALETLLFFHPAVWLVSRQVRLERENCCDDLAASVCGSRADYADALLAVAEMQAAMPQPVLAAGGFAAWRESRRDRPAARGRC